MHVALVNTNRIKPPIAPLGVEYLAEALGAAGHQVKVLDLCWPEEWRSAAVDFFKSSRFELVGISLRNTDDCVFNSRHCFLGEFADMMNLIRKHTAGMIVLGGVGFSVMPEAVLELCQADAGLWGAGESGLVELAGRLGEKRQWQETAGLVWRRNGRWVRNHPPSGGPVVELPPMHRNWVDNPRYFREGGQIGIETKRGCGQHCIYCADPVAKGRQVRIRPPKAVVDELEEVLQQGIDHIHTCDSEFNIPLEHAAELCQEIVHRNLGDRLRWYAYCSPVPFSPELAALMRRAGCVGINFGVDSGDEEMLERLRRAFKPQDILATARFCREAGIVVMFDLLLGAPGESRRSLAATIELMKQAEPDRVGVALGVRIYPETELAERIRQGKLHAGLVGGGRASEPLFFLEPEVASCAVELLDELIGDDERFFFFDPSRPGRNYNYNANERLTAAIGQGYRGAYWDILRRYN